MEPLKEESVLEPNTEEDGIQGKLMIQKTAFFVVWESSCRNFIKDDIQFSCREALDSLKVHVFLRSDTPKDAMPPEKEWIQNHFTLTTCPYASDTTIVSYLVEQSTMAEWLFNGESVALYLVSDRDRKYEEIIASLKSTSPKLQIREINGRNRTILEVLENVCHWCRMVFLSKKETERHISLLHNFFCFCSEKRFASQDELEKHRENQTKCPRCSDEIIFCTEEGRRLHLKEKHSVTEVSTLYSYDDNVLNCQFCPQKIFSSVEQRDIHMKNCHKKCNCSCGQFFRNRDDYLEHFYSVYPLACFENRKCPHRFQSVLHQARHHKQEHFVAQPYYCIPCQVKQTEDGSNSKICFRDENSLRIHGISMGHDLNEMFLPDHEVRGSLDQVDLTKKARRVPSRTCSAINYC